jgi:hypothetical protein
MQVVRYLAVLKNFWEGAMLKAGDIVFFKKCRRSSSRRSPEIRFNGHAFAIMLGMVPTFAKDPPPSHLLRILGTVGLISLDDIAEFLSTEDRDEVAKKFHLKYMGKLPDAPLLVKSDGSPLKVEDVGQDTPS